VRPAILFLASYFKSTAIVEQAHDLGYAAVLLSREELRERPWPQLEGALFLPQLDQPEVTVQAAGVLARDWNIRFVFPLDEEDVEGAARIREHLCLAGPGLTVAHNFRDKLTMRARARQGRLCVPEFVHLFNRAQIEHFTQKVSPDWVLKPRSKAGTKGIQKISSGPELAQALEELGDQSGFYLVEKEVEGDVFHLDSVVFRGQPRFVQAHRYGTPPFEICNSGGVFSTQSLDSQDADLPELLDFNSRVIQCLQLVEGITHIEFIRCPQSGRLFFLEAAARVGGANIDILVQETTGINLWREWIRVEAAAAESKDYQLAECRRRHGGMLTCLTKMEHPDMSPYDAPEVKWKLNQPYLAGMVIVSEHKSKVDELMRRYQDQLLGLVAH